MKFRFSYVEWNTTSKKDEKPVISPQNKEMKCRIFVKSEMILNSEKLKRKKKERVRPQ